MKEFRLRDRDDGQFEVVAFTPVMLGVFPDRDMADAFMRFLQSSETPISDGSGDLLKMLDAPVANRPTESRAKDRPAPQPLPRTQPQLAVPAVRLPAVIAPSPAAIAVIAEVKNEHAAMQEAFARIEAGERIGVIAPEYGLSLHQLRGRWAAFVKNRKDRMGIAGQIECASCSRSFTPSVHNMEKCARCSRD